MEAVDPLAQETAVAELSISRQFSTVRPAPAVTEIPVPPPVMANPDIFVTNPTPDAAVTTGLDLLAADSVVRLDPFLLRNCTPLWAVEIVRFSL